MKQKISPGYEGKIELIPEEVDSPYGHAKKDVVVRNVREFSLTWMHSRKFIDNAQLRAGEWARARFERLRLSSMVVDPSSEPVDVSGPYDPIPARVLDAANDLRKAANNIGTGWPLIERICRYGYTISEVASQVGIDRKKMGRLVRGALDALAVYLGFATDKRS